MHILTFTQMDLGRSHNYKAPHEGILEKDDNLHRKSIEVRSCQSACRISLPEVTQTKKSSYLTIQEVHRKFKDNLMACMYRRSL